MTPALPAGLTARPLSTDDAPAVAALLAAAEQVDDTGEYPDAEDVAEWWQGWGLDAARDGLAVSTTPAWWWRYATVMASPTFRDALDVYLEGRVRPTFAARASAGRCSTGSSTVAARCTPSGTRRRPAR